MNQANVVIIEENTSTNLEIRLVADVFEIMTVFSARLYGSRLRKNQQYLAKSA
jgi:predicted site-specific integrase-resolvase